MSGLSDKVRQGPVLPRQFLGIFQGALQNEPGHRVDVHGRGFAAQAHGLQGNGAAPAKGSRTLGARPPYASGSCGGTTPGQVPIPSPNGECPLQ